LRKFLAAQRINPFIGVILAAAGFLLFFHLDHRPFWQDEAETACLAKSILKTGLPHAFDGVNIISQEEGREFNSDYLWRWSPWAQLYITAAAFRLGGVSTYLGRFPFAFFGLLCVLLVYLLIKREFGDQKWACLAAALLAFSVPFLLFSRQCRYYSLGAFLTITAIYLFRSQWQTRIGPALILALSLGLLFHTNYLLFGSFLIPFLLAARLVYPGEMPVSRAMKLALGIGLIVLPSILLFQFNHQASLMRHFDFFSQVLKNLESYFVDLLQFMAPLPICVYLLWRWSCFIKIPTGPGERFVYFLSLIVVGNIFILLPVPQREFRYLVHLYPLVAIVMSWAVCKAYSYQKFSGVLLGMLLLFTNWLNIVPMVWLTIPNQPLHNDINMLTHPNLTLKNYLSELFTKQADVNQCLIDFFNRHAKPGDVILTSYGDLPLQFYTPFQVIGGLQGRVPFDNPDWIVKRYYTRYNREYYTNECEDVIEKHLNHAKDYQMLVLPYPDDFFGNRADPYYHRFFSPEWMPRLVVYRKK
jgi:4-amino-4-deoxy-L-arabinose transferase-like glycosyltransferase